MSVRVLSSDLQNKAKSVLNEVPSQTKEDIQNIRNWISQQTHLECRTDDQWILNFLRGCKFSLQKTKDKLDMFYSMRSLMPEVYASRDPLLPEIQEILQLGLCLPLLKTSDAAAPRVILLRCKPIDTNKIIFTNIVKVAFMIIDILLNEDDNFVVAGQHGLIDLDGSKINHILHMDIGTIKKSAICLQQGYPTRPQGFHVINVNSYLEILLKVVKPLLTEKLRKRINVYSCVNDDKFQINIDTSILPKEYGGSASSINELTSYWKKKVESYRGWFLEDSCYGSDETKRNSKRKTCNTAFGIEGTFRKLTID